jgi:hypothetical protein
MRSRDILHQAKGDHLGWVHSEDQMVLKIVRGGGWSGRAVAQWKPRVSKLGFKGLSDYHSNEMAVEAARREASGLNKRATLTKQPLKKREQDNSSKPNWIKSKRQPVREKTPRIKRKRCLLFSPGDACRWEMLKSMKMMMGENQSSQSQVHMQRFGVLRVKRQ